MASKSGFCRVTPAVASGSCSCKDAVGSVPYDFMSDNKFDKFAGPKKGISVPSHASAFVFAPAPVFALASTSAPAEISTPMYTKADFLRILKIISETKGQI